MIVNNKIKRFTAFTAVLLITVLMFTNTVSYKVNADVYRGVFQKEQSIINYGVELMDMEDSKAFEIYMAMLDINTETSTLRIDFDTAIQLQSKTQEEITVTDKDTLIKISEDAQIAMDAFMKDYPEIFWFDIGSSSSSAIIAKTKNPDGSETFSINGIKLKFEVEEAYMENVSLAYDTLLNELNSVVSRTNGLSRYEKLKYFHDYLCEHIEYAVEGENIFNLYGAIIDGKCVCQGYSEAFKALCDLSGVPCVLVSGASRNIIGDETNHMWNYCLMEDDNWYAVDVTWDDGDEIEYDYFLIGSQTVDTVSGQAFSDSHIPNGDFSFSGHHTFTYPVLNDSAYEVKKLPDIDDVVLGDVNYDGDITSADALEILKISARIRVGIEYELIAGDVDKSDVLDSNDALYVLKYAAKLITEFPANQ